MTRGKAKRILTQGEINDLKGMQSEAREQLKMMGVGTGTPADSMDKSKLQGQIDRYDRLIDEGKAPKVRGTNKDALAAEAKFIRERVVPNMLTRDQIQPDRDYSQTCREQHRRP